VSAAASRLTTDLNPASGISQLPPHTAHYIPPVLPAQREPSRLEFTDPRLVNSIVLITNGLSFAFQAVLFLAVGSLADYGVWRPHITTAFTMLAWGVSFGWLGVEDPSK
jgi:hypothetical protein